VPGERSPKECAAEDCERDYRGCRHAFADESNNLHALLLFDSPDGPVAKAIEEIFPLPNRRGGGARSVPGHSLGSVIPTSSAAGFSQHGQAFGPVGSPVAVRGCAVCFCAFTFCRAGREQEALIASIHPLDC